ncbi:hypothetical protein K353_05849 [Kitasatospora sp. SolWspMP-SS2h]|uniref:hypothetical protein n=1 Tax=Kitasatospora sp. SolWspMP-SS2h TaxID=1305729 RepID=UPI000DB935B7|nr:hypothetical protein [Kitasatospora sp. SolWspMP-SS2h]RAJ32851.1 hypothetical protein K353_05849 [Kitasatospora sp. SolWspMP-SS2h]
MELVHGAFRVEVRERDGGLDLVLRLDTQQIGTVDGLAAVLDLAQDVATVLHGLALLRAGGTDPAAHADVAAALDRRLIPRLEGIRDAAIRAHRAAGGSTGDVAQALGVSRSTAQYKRDTLRHTEPSSWEDWAVQGLRTARTEPTTKDTTMTTTVPAYADAPHEDVEARTLHRLRGHLPDQGRTSPAARADAWSEVDRILGREVLVRGAALADRDALLEPERAGDAEDAARALAQWDLHHAAGPGTDSTDGQALRGYVRSQYEALARTGRQGPPEQAEALALWLLGAATRDAAARRLGETAPDWPMFEGLTAVVETWQRRGTLPVDTTTAAAHLAVDLIALRHGDDGDGDSDDGDEKVRRWLVEFGDQVAHAQLHDHPAGPTAIAILDTVATHTATAPDQPLDTPALTAIGLHLLTHLRPGHRTEDARELLLTLGMWAGHDLAHTLAFEEKRIDGYLADRADRPAG